MSIPSSNFAVVAMEDDETSLVEVVNTIIRNWRTILVLPLVLSTAIALWSLSQERTYLAAASFMPQSAGAGMSGASALAQQFGMNLGGQSSAESPQFYVDLLQSTTVLRLAVESEYDLPSTTGRPVRGTLVEFWDEGASDGLVPEWRRATERLRAGISATVSRETGVVQLRVTSEHSVLAEQIAARLLELLNDFNLRVRQTRAVEERQFIGSRTSEAHGELRSAEAALQSFLRQNREFLNSLDLMFEHERLQRDVMMRQEVYTSLLRAQEQAQIDAARDVPLFTVIDHPEGTGEPQGRGTVSRTLLAFLIGVVLALVIAFVREFARRRKEVDDPYFREMQRLTREAGADIIRPHRWFRRRMSSGGSGDR